MTLFSIIVYYSLLRVIFSLNIITLIFGIPENIILLVPTIGVVAGLAKRNYIDNIIGVTIRRAIVFMLLMATVFYIYRILCNEIITLGTLSYNYYIILYYIYTPLFMSMMILWPKALLPKRDVFVTVSLILYIYLIVQYYAKYGKMPHIAPIAMIGIIVYSQYLHQILYEKVRGLRIIKAMTICVIVILITALGVLRGASILIVIITLYQLTYRIKAKKVKNIFPILVLLLVTAMLLESNAVKEYYSQAGLYGYASPADIRRALIEEDANRDVRIDWVKEALNVLQYSPLYGTAFEYRFDPFGRGDETSSVMLHNYYAAMIVDAGIILIVPYIIILAKDYNKSK